MITVVAIVRAKPGSADSVRAGLEKLIAPTHAEAANSLYVLHADLDDPNVFVFYEHWESRETFEEHLQSAHLRAFGEEAGDLLAAPLELHVLSSIAGER